ncbi:Imm41 family immunity protein [Paraburkholderia tropica]|uniref:Imm41 family immunity protein n=1 Tax=Paraburkholderia tropica TaxID=92647 RepID=UPI0009F41CFA|nr:MULTISPECIES: Imm41 family immunity protein [Paraburkholderia]MBB2984784.1 hypothetical protein [Paraburkholderia tropica]QNB16836.1 hypothetical protein G5S35_35300 [Paraburkholderia tropica]RQM43881.1 hypothetical protein EHZ19_31805 [Paraburkholderia bannensis]
MTENMNPRVVIEQNCSWCEAFSETSFVSILHEDGLWQREQYWLLEWAVCNLISNAVEHADVCAPIFQIFSRTIGLICSHLDSNDLFEIKNLERDDVYAFRERIQIVFEGFFLKRLPKNALFDELNPLLPKDGS